MAKCPGCGAVVRARRPGPVERATRERLRKLQGADSAIKAGAIAAARAMDDAPTASLLRELRLTVQALVAQAWDLEAAGRGGGPPSPPAAGSVDAEGDEDGDLADVIGMIGRGGGAA